jgi:hypothetical protein
LSRKILRKNPKFMSTLGRKTRLGR